MEQFPEIAKVVASCAVLAGLIAMAVYAVGKWRGGAEDDQVGANELMSKLPELRQQGQLTDTEFRTIKTLLAEHLQDQLSGNGDKG